VHLLVVMLLLLLSAGVQLQPLHLRQGYQLFQRLLLSL
jgi:hypothetical protein